MLADLAMRDGQPVVAFDLFGDLDLRRGGARVVALPGGSLTALVDAAVQVPARGVVYGASFENHPALVARLAERHALLGNTPQTLRAVRDPRRLGVGAARRGPRVPAHVRRRRPTTARAAGCASRCAAAAARACARGAAARCRPARSCRSASTGSRARRRRSATGWMRSCSGSPSSSSGGARSASRGHRWCGNVVPPRLPAGERDALLGQARAICSCLAGAFALRGLFGVDFVWDGERAWTIEVNPRPTASLEAIEAAYGVGVFGAHLRACAGELPQVEAERAGAAGKAVLFATEDVVIGDSVRWLERGVRDVPHPGERIAAGRPICTRRGHRRDAARRCSHALEEQAARLRAELEPRVEVAAGG